jgi:ribosomal protein S21
VSDRFKGLAVSPRPNEDPDRMIKRFMKKVRSDGILQEVYQRKGYEKPSQRRRRKSARARFLRKVEEQGPTGTRS